MAARDRRPLRRILVLLAALVVIVGAGWAVLFSPLLAVREVKVEGTRTLRAEQVEQAAQVPMGHPLARVSERQIADRVAALPPVDEVRVTRALTDQVVIEVTERVPRLVLQRDGTAYLVDAEGFAYAETTQPPPELLVAEAPADPETLRGLGAVAAAVPEGFLIDRAVAESPDSIVLHLPEDRQVVMGSGEQAALKFTVAESLLQSTDAAFVDVSAPDNPSTR